jgi:hypothetical protein
MDTEIISFTLNKRGEKINVIGWKQPTPSRKKKAPVGVPYRPIISDYWKKELEKMFRKW